MRGVYSYLLAGLVIFLNFLLFFNLGFTGIVELPWFLNPLTSTSSPSFTRKDFQNEKETVPKSIDKIDPSKCKVLPPEVKEVSCSSLTADDVDEEPICRSRHEKPITDPEEDVREDKYLKELLDFVPSARFGSYRTQSLVDIKYFGRKTVVVNFHKPYTCTRFVHVTVNRRQACFALASVRTGTGTGRVGTSSGSGSGSSYNLLRFHQKDELNGRLSDGTIWPTGFFRRPGKVQSALLDDFRCQTISDTVCH